MTPDTLSSTDSSKTTLDEKQESEAISQEEKQEDAEGLLTAVFQDGTPVIKRMVQLIWDENGIDLEAVYRREAKRVQEMRESFGVPPLNLPTWEEVAPT